MDISMDMDNPNVLMIIGAMKCGTTSLFKYLSDHPDIVPSKVKEPEFFCEKQRHRVKLKSYFELWPSLYKDKYHMEASTGYSKYPDEMNVPQRINEHKIRPKFIYIVRNPIKRLASYKTHLINRMGETLPDYRELINESKYYMQLEQFREYFPKQDILVIDFDDLAMQPALVVTKVCEFLDIDSSYQPDDFKVENSAASYNKVVHKILKFYYKSNIRNYLPNSLLGILQKLLTKLGSKEAQAQSLSEAEKNEVINQLSSDMKKLKLEYGIDTDKWLLN